ncbi:MAG: hypothetical protein K2O32_05980 [Acetatifactor sp.]|nr:hypothetical protein [Acetatifactor sp.]
MIKSLYRKWIVWAVMIFGCFTVAACGKQTDTESIEATETEISKMTESTDDTSSFTSEKATEAEAERENTDVITVHTTEITYSDKEIPVQYSEDLTLLDHMEQAGSSYAYRDGKVYYRQYHKDSFEEGAVYAYYEPSISGTDKEIVCVDADGEKAVLFSDRGYGNIYLIGERFYMTEMTEDNTVIYSVDMQGQNRIDHGCGIIQAVDTDKGVLIVETRILLESWETTYSVLNCKSGEMISLNIDGYASLWFKAYHDGWCYFEACREKSDQIYRVVAVSLEGEQREIIALAPDNSEEYLTYSESICEMKVVRDRIYLVFGGYAGSGSYFQGGTLITIKLDGSDYRAVELSFNADVFCVCYDDDMPYVYFYYDYIEEEKNYYTSVWDVEADTVFLSDFPEQLLWAQLGASQYEDYKNARVFCVWHDAKYNVYALPDDSSRIVQVVTQIDDIIQRDDDDEYNINYKHFYYADGFLYFQVEYNIYSKEYSLGWRDGYIRFQTDVYRMKPDENLLELLYSF